MTLTINIPEIYEEIDLDEKRVAIETPRLDSRITRTLLALLFEESSESWRGERNLLFLADRTVSLRAELEGWLRSGGFKTKKRGAGLGFEVDGTTLWLASTGDLDITDPPFVGLDRAVICDAHRLPLGAFEAIDEACRGPITVSGEFTKREHWFYKYARDPETRLHRFPADHVLSNFPDQQKKYDALVTGMSESQVSRFLDLEDIELEIRRLKMLDWLKQYLPHHFTLPFSSLHEYFCTRMERMADIRGVKEGSIAPRGNSKTTVASLGYPLYAICEELEDYIILAADSMSQAIQRVEAIAHELTNNSLLAKDYPHVFDQGAVWNKHHIVTRNGVHVQALGIRKKIRGAKQQQFRPSCIISDDLDDDDIPFSPKKREKNIRWVEGNLLNLGKTDHTNYFFVGTALHQECVVCQLPKKGIHIETFSSIIEWPDRMDLWRKWEDMLIDLTQHDVEKRKRKAKAFYLRNKKTMDEGSEVLWPEYENLYSLMILRSEIGTRAFESEKQGNHVDPSLCEWDPKHFDGNIFFDEWPVGMEVKTMALDPSKGKEDKPGDYQAMAMLGIKDGVIYIDVDLSRRPVDEMLEQYIDHMWTFQPDVAVIEDAAFQDVLLYLADDIALRKKMSAAIEPLPHGGIRKVVRIRRLGPYVLRAQCRYKKTPGIQIFLDQMRAFPNGSYDDGPDAVEMALRKARLMLGGRSQKPVETPF